MPDDPRSFCSLAPHHRPLPPEALAPDLERSAALRIHALKWANWTTISYAFFDYIDDGSQTRHPWRGREEDRDVVRKAFKIWKKVGIGLSFREVTDPTAALIRIGFAHGEGSWSYIGTSCLAPQIPASERTMNFGWSLLSRDGLDTALHEIGHALGMPHEHQNPEAGIVWDEKAVKRHFARPPNSWGEEKIVYNILRKLPEGEIEGGPWDRDSVMHYTFPAGLIRQPAECQGGIMPAGGLSPQDKAWARIFYPPEEPSFLKLVLGNAQDILDHSGAQTNFVFVPRETRLYKVAAIGDSDKRITIVEEGTSGEETLLKCDDDSGHDRDASVQIELIRGRRYKILINTSFSRRSGIPQVDIR